MLQKNIKIYHKFLTSSRPGKTISLFTLIRHQPGIDKIYLAKYKKKYQPLIDKRGSTSLKNCKDSKTFTECLKDDSDIWQKHWRLQSK